MPDPVPNPELLRSLGRLVRGLSALFWGLPLALIACVQTAKTDWLLPFKVFPPLVTTGLLLYGLCQLGSFQKQERPWRSALDRARLFGLVNFGLSPFLYWWNRVPEKPFFVIAVAVLAFSALLFLIDVNFVLRRLGAMLPDEALRLETRQYTKINHTLLIALVTLIITYLITSRILQSYFVRHLPVSGEPAPLHWLSTVDILSIHIPIPALGVELTGLWLVGVILCLLVLLPLAMTMALIWKTKEVILESVFGARG